MTAKKVRATFDGHAFHVIDPIDLAPDSENLITIREIRQQENVDPISYLFSIAGTVHGPEDWSVGHDHYLVRTPKKTDES